MTFPLRDFNYQPGFYLDKDTQEPGYIEGQGGAANSLLYAWSPSLLMPLILTVDNAGALNVTGSSGSGGGAVTIIDGGDVAQGSTTDAAVVTDAAGTLSGKMRGLVKWAYERMPASLGQKTMALSLPVTLASDQSAVAVSGTVTATGPLTDTQLRASAVPVSGTVTASIAGSVTASVTGSVTANAGTNLNTSLLALEAGGNLATIAGKDFATQTTLSSLNSKVVAVNTGSVTVIAMPSVTASVTGSVTANAGTNLNTSLLALESGGNLASLAGKDFATQTTLSALNLKVTAADTGNVTVVAMPTVTVTGSASAYGMVTDSALSYTAGDVEPISLSGTGRLLVETVGESYNMASWGSPEVFSTNYNQRTISVW